MPTIADQPITRGEIRLSEQGDWFADIATNSGERLPDGTRVEIVAETLTLSGAIVRGGITDAVGRYQVAGRPEWGLPLPARPTAAYRSAGSVLRSTVLTDIARDVLGSGWASLVVLPAEAKIGTHYLRSGASGDVVILGRDALALLDVPWYVRNDGITVFAVRPAGPVTTAERILVEYRNDAIGYRVVNCEDPGAFMPGLTFEGEIIGDVTFSLMPEDIKVHVWSRAASSSFGDALRAVWRRLFPRVELQGLFTYMSVGASQNGKHDLRSTRSRHLPDVELADSWSAAGLSAELAAGTQVVLSFADGDPSSPILVATEPRSGAGHVPVRVYQEASSRIDVVSASAGNVYVAGETPTAAATPLIEYLQALELYLATIDPTILAAAALLGVPPPFDVPAITSAIAARVAAAGYTPPSESASFSSLASTRLHSDQAPNVPGPPGPGA